MDGGVNWIDITGVIRGYVYALRSSDGAFPRSPGPIPKFRSPAGGLRWLPNSHPASAYELTFDHLVSGTIYAGAKDTYYRSTDFGQSWTPSVAGPAGTCASLISTSAGLFFGSSAGIDRSADGEPPGRRAIPGSYGLDRRAGAGAFIAQHGLCRGLRRGFPRIVRLRQQLVSNLRRIRFEVHRQPPEHQRTPGFMLRISIEVCRRRRDLEQYSQYLCL